MHGLLFTLTGTTHEPNGVLLQRQLDHSSKSPDTRSHRLSSATQLVGLCLQPLQVDERHCLSCRDKLRQLFEMR